MTLVVGNGVEGKGVATLATTRGLGRVTLYEHVGGEEPVTAAVESFYTRMLNDSITAKWFAGVELDQLKAHQRAFLTVGLGGPELYNGRSMRNAHAGLGVTDEIFTRALGHLNDALDEVGVEPSRAAQIVRNIELMRAAIVEVL